MLGAGVSVHRPCKPLSVLSFKVFVVLVCVSGVLIFLKGRKKYFEFSLALEQTYSLASFGLCVGLCGLSMCMTAVFWLYVFVDLSLRCFLFVEMFLKFYEQSADICHVSQNFFCIFQRLILVCQQDW
jgi:hypothetical protein